MKGIEFSKSMFINSIIRIFVPILSIVLVVGFILFMYSKHAENKGISNYKKKVDFHSALISIVITLVLLAITSSFSVNFINIMHDRGLVDANKLIYYVVLCSPLIPFLFLIYLIIRFVKSISQIKATEIEEDGYSENDEVTFGIKYKQKEENKTSNDEEVDNNIELL